jgi:tryptophanyl-tRNA synthetase
MTEEQVVNPWVAYSTKAFDYQRLLTEFGLEEIDDSLTARIEKATGMSVHPFLKRKIFFAHKDLEKLLSHYESGKEIYIYTGRGPSSDSLHLGHILPLSFTVYLQKAFKAIVVVEMSDLEKAMFKPNLSLAEATKYSFENAKDMIALGFDKDRTFFFNNSEYIEPIMPLVFKIWKKTSLHHEKKVYGFEDDANIGMVAWPAFEQVPCFPEAFPHIFKNDQELMCMVVCSVDQFPFFRSFRDFVESMGGKKPVIIAGKFLTGLRGAGGKMSSSTGEEASIFLSDPADEIARKVKNYAFSGGKETLAEHREKGGDITVDVPYIYLHHFLHDDQRLQKIADDYTSGKMPSGEIKKIMTDVLIDLTKDLQEKRAAITPEVLQDYFSRKPLKTRFD